MKFTCDLCAFPAVCGAHGCMRVNWPAETKKEFEAIPQVKVSVSSSFVVELLILRDAMTLGEQHTESRKKNALLRIKEHTEILLSQFPN